MKLSLMPSSWGSLAALGISVEGSRCAHARKAGQLRLALTPARRGSGSLRMTGLDFYARDEGDQTRSAEMAHATSAAIPSGSNIQPVLASTA
jgi:hypothetical protein